METACGPSDKWILEEGQATIEDMVNKYVVQHASDYAQPEHLERHTFRKWIDYAYANGDMTYSLYTGGKSLYEPYVTYHHLADVPKEVLLKVANQITTGEGFDDTTKQKETTG